MPGFPQPLPTLCPFSHQGYPQVIHLYVGAKVDLTPNILCFGLDKSKTASYHSRRYIEALGHKWRACSGASYVSTLDKFIDPPHVPANEGFGSSSIEDD